MSAPPAVHKPFPIVPILILLVCAAAASAIFWQATIKTTNVFSIPEAIQKTMGQGATPEQLAAYGKADKERKIKQTALEGAILGASACGLLGLGLGLASRSVLRTLGCLVVGVLLGGVFGAAGGFADQILFFELPPLRIPKVDVDPDGLRAMVTHGTLLGLVALGLGPVAGLASGSLRGALKVVLAGIGAALITALLFPLLAGYFFPQAHPETSIPGGPGELVRFAWLFLWSGLAAIACGRILDFHPVPAPAPSAEAPPPAQAPSGS